MNDLDPKNWKKGIQHPTDDDLLCLIDGELDQASTDNLRLHLEACWPCRRRADKFQAAISSFIDYRSQVLLRFTENPGNWGGFNSRLQRAVSETRGPSVSRSFWLGLKNLRSSMADLDVRSARLSSISVATILLLVVGFYFLFPNPVSADELLTLALSARDRELTAAKEPVVYQQIRITRRVASGEETANVELWQDTTNGRLKQIGLPLGPDSAASITGDLAAIMRASGYQPPPLVVAGYQAWRNDLANKHDTVTDERMDDGMPVWRLKTEITGAVKAGKIVSSSLTVRQRDYHPIEQRFLVRTANGDDEYEFRETSFAVMSLSSLKTNLFDDSISAPSVVATKPAASPNTAPNVEPVPGAVNSNANPDTSTSAAPATATTELEIEVLSLLHNAGADRGEQIEVRRSTNGTIRVSGVVEDISRKNQILAALQTVSGNPAVLIQINTVAEEVARQKQGKAQAPPVVETVEVDSSTFPAEADLRAHLSGNDQAVKQFASRAISRSSSAMNYLWAMRRLKEQFSRAELGKLTPEARAKWLNIVRSHARSYKREIGQLKSELQPVFGNSSGSSEVTNITDDANLIRAIEQLFAAGSSVNQIVRQALTSGSGTNALRTARFWHMVNQAEATAKTIADVRTN